MVVSLLLAQALGTGVPAATAEGCAKADRISRTEILQAMRSHGGYSITSTTTSMRFGAEALLALARRRQKDHPESSQFFVDQSDWFTAHLEAAGVAYDEMSAAARAAFEHHQDALVEYGPQVVDRVVEGPAPVMALDVTIFWPDSAGVPSEFGYRDTLSVPRMEVYNQRIIRFKLLEYDDMLVFDQVTGISMRPLGFLSTLFRVLGKPDVKQTRIAISADQWQVVRGHLKVFPGFSQTGTAAVEPGGRGHQGLPPGRADLRALRSRLDRPLELRYGSPSCQAKFVMAGQ